MRDTIAVARKLAENKREVVDKATLTPECRRHTPPTHRARPGRQAPRSGWQGTPPANPTATPHARPADTIAVARKLAENKEAA